MLAECCLATESLLCGRGWAAAGVLLLVLMAMRRAAEIPMSRSFLLASDADPTPQERRPPLRDYGMEIFCLHTYMHTPKHTHTETQTHTLTHTLTHTHIHIHIQTHANTNTCILQTLVTTRRKYHQCHLHA